MNFLQYWYEALGSSHGVVLSTTDRDRLRAKLYEARREACDPSLEALSLIFSPTAADEVWIIHNDQKERDGTPDKGDAEPLLE